LRVQITPEVRKMFGDCARMSQNTKDCASIRVSSCLRNDWWSVIWSTKHSRVTEKELILTVHTR